MAIIKQTETFLKPFGSIRPTIGGKGKMDELDYSTKGLSRTWISRNHVLFELIIFLLPNSSLFLFKIYAFVKQFEDASRILLTFHRSIQTSDCMRN